MQHLQAELQRIEMLIRREVWRWQLAGQDPHDDFRGLYVSDEQALALLERPFGSSWGDTVTLPAEQAQALTRAESEAMEAAQQIKSRAHQQGRPTRLSHLATTFGLDRFALDAFLVCLAPHLDLRYAKLYGYLQDDVTSKYPSVNLILNLLGRPGGGRLQALAHFSDTAPLFRYRLLQLGSNGHNGQTPALLSQTLHVDPAIVTWLLGRYEPPAELRGHVGMQGAVPGGDERLLAGEAWKRIAPALKYSPLLVFHGPDEAAQDAAARLAAVQVQRPLLHVNLAPAINAGLQPETALHLALRDARLNGALPYLSGWDALLTDGSPPPHMLATVCRFPGPVIVAGRERWQAQGFDRERPLLWIEFHLPTYPQRQGLWQHFIAQVEPAHDLPIEPIAGQFILTTAQIRDAVITARDRALQRGESMGLEDLFAGARAHSNPRLAHLARKITPRYVWDDIILPDDPLAILQEVVMTVRGRPQVLEQWGVGQQLAASNGVTMLFAGPPGTGKTMAAEVIASELGLDLYKIDLSTVISKYIGETEKNLERIFDEAQSSNAILFFDEADALFGKRSEVKDAHDRYANIEISYLLQRMEAYDGVTILATNLRANLDEAFTRRLQFALDFPFPEEEDRLRIWETLFPADVPRADDFDFEVLARRFKLAGGNIRNIIVASAFLAAADESPVTMDHLLHATRREMQKMGRLIKEADLRQ